MGWPGKGTVPHHRKDSNMDTRHAMEGDSLDNTYGVTDTSHNRPSGVRSHGGEIPRIGAPHRDRKQMSIVRGWGLGG